MIVLEGEGAAHPLKLDSLNQRASGRVSKPKWLLLSVREAMDEAPETATVWVSDAYRQEFLKLFEDYLDDKKNSKNGRPRNQTLVANICRIRDAVLNDLWTSDSAPPNSGRHWWELWLDANSPHIDAWETFVASCRLQSLRRELRFGDRLIVWIEATWWCHRVVATVLVREGLLVRRLLTVTDRAGIARGLAEGCGLREIARRIGRDVSVVSREVARNQGETGYKCVAADVAAQRRRARPKLRKIDADLVLKQRVIADLRRSRTPRQIAGRLRAEVGGDRLEPCQGSPTAQGASVSHEAIYTWIYAMPKKTLREHGVMLGSKRTSRQSRRRLGERKSPIVGMVSIDQRPQEVTGRKVPGHWEADLIIGAYGRTAAITLVERTTRFVTILALPKGKNADGVCDALIDHITGLPELMKGTLTWDQGSEMARHAAFTMATQMPVYFAHPHSPWERGSNENTNRLIRDYLPKGTPIPQHQPYLTAIAEELNERPRATLGYLTPREAFQKLLVASTT